MASLRACATQDEAPPDAMFLRQPEEQETARPAALTSRLWNNAPLCRDGGIGRRSGLKIRRP